MRHSMSQMLVGCCLLLVFQSVIAEIPEAVITVTSANNDPIVITPDNSSNTINAQLARQSDYQITVKPTQTNTIIIGSVTAQCGSQSAQYTVVYGSAGEQWVMKEDQRDCDIKGGIAQCHFTSRCHIS